MHPAVDDLGLQSADYARKLANPAEFAVAHHVLLISFAQPTKGPPMADDNDQLPSIDDAQLAAVTGGASGGSTEAITALLTSLMSSIKDLASSRQNSNPFGDMMPMIMMMMMNRPQPQQQVVAAGPAVGPDGTPIGPGGWERVA
ncbi:MAG TPA: hypothetical protein VIV11_13870 [Kofleriaceae bacterium]